MPLPIRCAICSIVINASDPTQVPICKCCADSNLQEPSTSIKTSASTPNQSNEQQIDPRKLVRARSVSQETASLPLAGFDQRLMRYREYLLLLARVNMPAKLKRKLDASDVVQQALLRAHHAVDQYRGATSAEEAAWLHKILANILADEARRFGRSKRDLSREKSLQAALDDSSMMLNGWLAADQSTPSQKAMGVERALALAEALARLPDDQRTAIELIHLKGLSSTQTACKMRRSDAAVAGLLRRGLKALRGLLAEFGAEQ